MIEQLSEQEQNILTCTLYNVLFTNDIAMGHIYDAMQLLEKSSLWRGRVKQRGGYLKQQMRLYNGTVTRMTRNPEFVAELNEEFSEMIQMDLLKLELTVKNYMHKCHVPDVELQMLLALSDIFTSGALKNYDLNCTRPDNPVHHLMHSFRHFCITGIKDSFRAMYDEIQKIYARRDYYCDLNSNEDIFNGFVVICRKLSDPERIMDVIATVERRMQPDLDKSIV